METFMKAKFVAAAVMLAAISAPAFAQQDKAPPAPAPASKADVEKLVAGIKADKAKLDAFCAFVKLDDQAQKASEANDQKKVEELSKQIDEAVKKLGPDFDKVAGGADQTSSVPLEELAKTCK
jgi:hypothetical protein